MKKILKKIIKIIIIDLLIVLLISTIMVTKETLKIQNSSVPNGKGAWTQDYSYTCGYWSDDLFHCNLTTRLKESLGMIPLYIIFGGFSSPLKNPYAATNYLFIILLSAYIFKKK